MRACVTLGLGLALTGAGLASGDDLPISAFAGLPEMSNVRISPDGDRILMLRRVDNAMQPFVADLQTGRGSQPISIRHGRQILRACEWASNERIVCSWLKYYKLRAGAVIGGDGYPARSERTVRLLAVDHDGSNPLELVPKLRKPQRVVSRYGSARMSRLRPSSSEPDHRVISYLPRDRQHILVAIPRDYLYSWSVYRLNIHTNDMSEAVAQVSPMDMAAMRWSADGDGVIRIATGLSRQADTWGQREIAVRSPTGGFRLAEANWLDNKWLPPRILGFSSGGETAYIESPIGGSGRLGIQEVDSISLEVERSIATDPLRDVTAETVAGERCGVVGFDHTASNRFTWLDPAFGDDVDALDAKVPGRVRSIPSMTADCQWFLAVVDGEGVPPTWYMHHRKTGETRRLGAERPALDGDVAHTRVANHETRDDRPVEAMLTLPANPGDRRLPLVVIPTGGQHSGIKGYDEWAQFLASRGYAVLRAAPRGTPGYGADHWREGLVQWGAKLQNDLADGVATLAADGIVDPNRVCYAGRGRSGYLALAASVGDNSKARCSASFAFADAAHADESWDARHLYHYWHWTSWLGRPDWWVKADALGHGRADIAADGKAWESTARTPFAGARRPGIPFLIASPRTKGKAVTYRANDRAFAEAVEAAGKLERMWHRGSATEVAFLDALERFLADEIGRRE